MPSLKIVFAVFISNFFFCAKSVTQNKNSAPKARAYYLNASGNDKNDGSINKPWQNIQQLNSTNLHPGDTVFFEGGQTFNGSILVSGINETGAPTHVIIASHGNGHAIINGGNGSAITIIQSKYISVKNLLLVGSGRKDGNTKPGIAITNCDHVIADSLDITGFQKAGLLIYASSVVTVMHVYAHENGAAGIAIDGPYGQKGNNYTIYIANCLAEDNPGDPSNLTNQSGNGIVAGNCRNVLIEYCTATNNGWDMPRKGNGPVGIWAYEADSVIIQHCLSYRNKTPVGATDGGGFDLDGGVTHSIIQYCLSYQNQGAGYAVFQYLYASPWHDNIYRYNISEDDGAVSGAGAGVTIWNSSLDSNQFYNCLFYNNTIYNTKGAAISYSSFRERKQFAFYNNIFVAADSLIKGERGIDIFLANDWWSLTGQFSMQEILSGKNTALNIDPGFTNRGNTITSSASALSTFDQYHIPANSPLRDNGLDLHNMYGIQTGNIDFNAHTAPAKGIGACFK